MKKQYKIKSSLVLGILALLTTLGGAVAITNHQANAEGESCTAKSGTYDGVDWEITTDCQLVIGKAGQTQTLTNRSSRIDTSYPWNDDRANIKTINFAGQVIGQGSLNQIFRSMTNLTNIENLTNLDTSNVIGMNYMFSDASSLTSLDLSNFDTSNASSMGAMFYNNSSLTSLDVSNFDTSNATNINSMFYGASSITNLDLSNFNTSNVTSMAWMFGNMPALTSLNISSFDTSNVVNMTGMFAQSTGLTSLDLSNFDTSSVTSMRQMFAGASGVTSLDLSSFDTSNVSNMSNMFRDTTNLNSITFGDGWANWVSDAYLMTPPTNTTTGKWIKTDGTLPSKTPAELYTELPANISTYAGTWVWEVIQEEPINPEVPINPNQPSIPDEITVPNTGAKSTVSLGLPILAVISGLSLFGSLVLKHN